MTKRLIVLTEAVGSGLGRVASHLVQSLSDHGLAVTFVAPPQPYEPATAARIVLLSARGMRRGKYIALIRSALSGCLHVLRLAGPEHPLFIVQLSPTFPVSALPVVAALIKRAPIILNLHDFYQQTLRFPRRLQPLERFLYRLVYRVCTVIVTTTPEQQSRLSNEVGIPAGRMLTFLHPPFTYEGIHGPSSQTPCPTLLVFGSLRKNKRIRESIEAVLRLRGQGMPVELRIAGEPPRVDRDYWLSCKALIGDNPGFEVRDRFVAEEDVPSVMSGVDALLCPYADFDSQSGVVITAVSNGIPIIGSAAALASQGSRVKSWEEIPAPVDAGAIAGAVARFTSIPRSTWRERAETERTRMLATMGWQASTAQMVEQLDGLGLWPCASPRPLAREPQPFQD